MMHSSLSRWTIFAWIIALAGLPAVAQEVRDPTVAPAETGSFYGSPIGMDGMAVLMRDGRAYLMVGTRLYAPGDKVGTVRVDRITETHVWLRDGKKRIKLPRFAGIERKSLAPESRCAPAASHQRTQSTVAPCEDIQPRS